MGVDSTRAASAAPICALCLSRTLWRASVSGTEEAPSVRMFDAKDETGTGVGLDEAASVRTFEPGTLDSGEAESVRTSMKSFDDGTGTGFREAASVRTFEPDTIGCREAASVRTFDALRVASASGAWRSSA